MEPLPFVPPHHRSSEIHMPRYDRDSDGPLLFWIVCGAFLISGAIMGFLIRCLLSLWIVLFFAVIITAAPRQTKIKADRPPQTRIKTVDDSKPTTKYILVQDRWGNRYYTILPENQTRGEVTGDCPPSGWGSVGNTRSGIFFNRPLFNGGLFR